jgi:hypothetical protein
MTLRSHQLVIVLACCVVVGAGIGWNVWRARNSNAHLFDTNSLVAQELRWAVCGGRCAVRGTLVNHSPRAARSAIVVLEMRDPDGNVIATNPMVEILHVPGNTDKPFEGLLHVPRAQEQVTVTATVAAARWE